MAIDFNQLRALSNGSLSSLQQAVSSMNQTVSRDDDDGTFWSPTIDKAGNGFAVIRFLAAPPGEDLPFIRYWHHAFQGPGGWYIEKSLTTLGETDPCNEYNQKLWATEQQANRDFVQKKSKRKLTFVANILIIQDPAKPEFNGQVKRFKFGKKIFDKINDAMHPPETGEPVTPFNPFDFWGGADFRLRIRKVDGYTNYDTSSFDTPKPLSNDDAEIERIWRLEHPLASLITRDKFKSYEQLQDRLNRALAINKTAPSAAKSTVFDEALAVEPVAASQKETATVTPPWEDDSADLDADLAFFTKLANG